MTIIENILEEGIDFTQLCVETHARFFDNGEALLDKMIAQLNDCGYKVFAVSDDEQDLSFIKANRRKPSGSR